MLNKGIKPVYLILDKYTITVIRCNNLAVPEGFEPYDISTKEIAFLYLHCLYPFIHKRFRT